MLTLPTMYYRATAFLSVLPKRLRGLWMARANFISTPALAPECVNLDPLDHSVKHSAAEVVSRQADTAQRVKPVSPKMFHGAYSSDRQRRSSGGMKPPAPFESRHHRASPAPPAYHARRLTRRIR